MQFMLQERVTRHVTVGLAFASGERPEGIDRRVDFREWPERCSLPPAAGCATENS